MVPIDVLAVSTCTAFASTETVWLTLPTLKSEVKFSASLTLRSMLVDDPFSKPAFEAVRRVISGRQGQNAVLAGAIGGGRTGISRCCLEAVRSRWEERRRSVTNVAANRPSHVGPQLQDRAAAAVNRDKRNGQPAQRRKG